MRYEGGELEEREKGERVREEVHCNAMYSFFIIRIEFTELLGLQNY
jgi:hypothetical protein